jgi:hypothetical protein
MSNKVVVGSIPDKICYVYNGSKQVSVGCTWDIDYGPEAKNITEEVLPTFPADNNDIKMLSTAINWAKSNYQYSNRGVTTIPDPNQDVVDNEIITNVKVLSVESRGNNGRAYKALIGKYYVDLREDVVMDTMLQSGVDAGGVLKGEFIWTKCGSQMKLVRVGSELHKIIVEFDSKKSLKPVGKNKLEVGTIYQTRKKQKALFLGCVDTIQLKNTFESDNKEKYRYKSDYHNPKYLEFTETKITKQMLFLSIKSYQTLEDNLKVLDKTNDKDYSNYHFELKKAHNYIEKVESIDLDPDVLEIIRSNCLNKIKLDVLDFIQAKKNPHHGGYRGTAYNLSLQITDYSKFINMSLHKTKPKEVFDLKKYLIFS